MVDRLAWLIVGAVIVVWVTTSLIFPLLIKNYTPPPSVGVVMGSCAGGAAAFLFARRSDRNGKKGDEDE